MLNALTVDIEEGWSIFSRDVLSMDIDPLETVVVNTERILETLSARNTNATFFIVGNVAVKYPSLIKSIASAGHELGVHGFSHKQIFRLTKEEFRCEIKRSKDTIENLTSMAAVGYRAPVFSLVPQTKWALRILAEEGFKFDSSIVPCNNSRYGWKGFSKDICRMDVGDGLSIVEVPMSILSIPMTNKGFLTGGGYLRHFPYFISCAVIKHIQKTRPAVIYIHPYEFGQEVVNLPLERLPVFARWRAICNIAMGVRNRRSVPAKVQKLLSDFEFGTVKQVIDKWIAHG